MNLKVCGLKNPSNIRNVGELKPEFMGFIFAKNSPRYVQASEELIAVISELKCDRVGVFVDEEVADILVTMAQFNLNTVQLHGSESPQEVERLAEYFNVIKAFQIDEKFDFNLREYAAADYFLFDTKGKKRGGNGIKFDWSLLDKYHDETPFLLSGGIELYDTDDVLSLHHPNLAGIDVNSGFEDYPGFKNIELLEQLKQKLDEVHC